MKENESLQITIQLTDLYVKQFDMARSAADYRKCRSWITKDAVIDGKATVVLNESNICLKYNSRKGTVEEKSTYDSVLSVTETRQGILIRLSHKRLLLLPVSNAAKDNEKLVDAMETLGKYCRYFFKIGSMPLTGVRIMKRLDFRFRPNQGPFMLRFSLKVPFILLLCLVTFIATIFVSEPYRQQRIDKTEAIYYFGEYVSYEEHIRKHNIMEVDILFANMEEQTLDGSCVSDAFMEHLEAVPEGTMMELLVHPHCGYIVEMKTEDQIILDFADASNRLWREAIGFLVLGVFLYGTVVYLSVAAIRKKL